MIELKKTDLEHVLLTISTYSPPKEGEPQKMISGLLMEDLPLGAKRKLQKIHKGASVLYKELIEDFKKVAEECGEDKEKLEKELKELLEESIKVDAEHVQLSLIENISSTNNYNFDVIEKFAI